MLCAVVLVLLALLALHALVHFPRLKAAHQALATLHTRVARQIYFFEFLTVTENVTKIVCHENPRNKRVIVFVKSLIDVVKFVLLLSAVMVLVSIPLYAVKAYEVLHDDFTYSMYHNVFWWFFSFAYITGQVPVMLIIAAWIIMLTVFVWYVSWKFLMPSQQQQQLEGSGRSSFSGSRVRGYSSTGSSTSSSFSGPSSRSGNSDELESGDGKKLLVDGKTAAAAAAEPNRFVFIPTMVAIFVLNLAVTITVNSSYVYSTTRPLTAGLHLLIQLFFALFNYMYTLTVLPLLSKPIKDPAIVIWFRLVLLVLNQMVIPCVATALTSPACFQGLFFGADERTSSYTYLVTN
jgi:hypothetical protein